MSVNRTLFVTGGTGFLGSHFVYRLLQGSTPVVAMIRGASEQIARDRLLRTLDRAAASYCEPFDRAASLQLHLVRGDLLQPECGVEPAEFEMLSGVVDEFWHLAASLQYETRQAPRVHEHNVGGTKNAIALCRRLGAKRFVYVSTAYVAGRRRGRIPEGPVDPATTFNNNYEESKAIAESVVQCECQAADIDYRIVRPSIIVGPYATKDTGGSTTGLYGFVRELEQVRDLLNRSEIELKAPADPDTLVNLVPVDAVVNEMIALHREGFGRQRYYHLVNQEPSTVRELMDAASDIIKLKPVELVPNYEPSSPLETVMARRFEFYSGYFLNPKVFESTRVLSSTIKAADVPVYIRKSLHEQTGRAIDAVLARSVLRTRDGLTLSAFSAGNCAGSTVVLVNAYGMAGDFVAELARQFVGEHRVLSWETRGVPCLVGPLSRASAQPRAHVEDLLDLLNAHAVREPVHLIGWCSGAQIAHRFARCNPERVASLCMLNGAYYFDAAPLTAFQENMRTLMPRIAASLNHARFYYEVAYGRSAESATDVQSINHVLEGVDPTLVAMTGLPFQSPESLHRYAMLVDELFRDGEEQHAGEVHRPCLLISGRQDRVAHYEGSRMFAERARGARHVVMEPGDHYSLYLDPELATIVERFIREIETSPTA